MKMLPSVKPRTVIDNTYVGRLKTPSMTQEPAVQENPSLTPTAQERRVNRRPLDKRDPSSPAPTPKPPKVGAIPQPPKAPAAPAATTTRSVSVVRSVGLGKASPGKSAWYAENGGGTAEDMTARATESGKPEDHHRAAIAHDMEGNDLRRAGDKAGAIKHFQQRDQHRQAAQGSLHKADDGASAPKGWAAQLSAKGTAAEQLGRKAIATKGPKARELHEQAEQAHRAIGKEWEMRGTAGSHDIARKHFRHAGAHAAMKNGRGADPSWPGYDGFSKSEELDKAAGKGDALPTYSDKSGWKGGEKNRLYHITDKRTGGVQVRPVEHMRGIGPEADVRHATRAEAEQHWQKPLHAGWKVKDEVAAKSELLAGARLHYARLERAQKLSKAEVAGREAELVAAYLRAMGLDHRLGVPDEVKKSEGANLVGSTARLDRRVLGLPPMLPLVKGCGSDAFKKSLDKDDGSEDTIDMNPSLSKSQFFREYKDARQHAETQAKTLKYPHGIEASKEYGRKGFSVKMVPRDPKNRQGHEMRMEIVEPPKDAPELGKAEDSHIGSVGKTAGKPLDIGGGLYVHRHGNDANGNHSVWVSKGSGAARKIQTNGNLPSIHSARGSGKKRGELPISRKGADEIAEYHSKHIAKSEGTPMLTLPLVKMETSPAGLDKAARTPAAHNEDNVRELHLSTINEGKLHPLHEAIRKNLVNKMAAGKYDHSKAPQAFSYLADAGAAHYEKQHGTPGQKIFSAADRRETARRLADEFHGEAELGEHDHLLNKKNTAAKASTMGKAEGLAKMDPDAAHQRFKSAVAEGDHEEAAEAHGDLKQWLGRGGFKPKWSKQEEGAFKAYGAKGMPKKPMGKAEGDDEGSKNIEWSKIPPGVRVEDKKTHFVAHMPSGPHVAFWGSQDARQAQQHLARRAAGASPAPKKVRFPGQMGKAEKPDGRYSIAKEYTGHISGKPQHVVRFADKFVGSHPTKEGAAAIRDKHMAERQSTLSGK